MDKHINRESSHGIHGLAMKAGENILLCLHTDQDVSNPLNENKKHPETAVITNKRLIVLAQDNSSIHDVILTSMPLDKIETVQTTCVSWNTASVLVCIVAFLFFVIPGIAFLFCMESKKGATVNVCAGSLRSEVKFHPDSNALLQDFVALL